MLSTVLYYELAMKVPIPVGITVYLLTWGLGHLRCLVIYNSAFVSIRSVPAARGRGSRGGHHPIKMLLLQRR